MNSADNFSQPVVVPDHTLAVNLLILWPGSGRGIDQKTAPPAAGAGANVLVAGTSIFGAPTEWSQP